MKTEYVFYNKITGHHHVHMIDDSDSEIVAHHDVYDVPGEKPYTRERAVTLASREEVKLDERRKSVLASRGLENMTRQVKEMTPDKKLQESVITDMLTEMQKRKAESVEIIETPRTIGRV